jgi:cyclopropane fatty-acyl-phospholipid synthase-like methyltransferase
MGRLVIAGSLLATVMTTVVAMAPPQQPEVLRPPDVVFIPTPESTVGAMLKLAKVTKDDVVYDLGSGDGRIVIAAARQYGARGVGIDIDPQRIKEANANAQAAGVTDRVTFIQGDIFDPAISIRDASVVTLYLLTRLNEKLRPRLLKELRPGTRIVSHSFTMGPDWPAERSEQAERSYLYLWTIPNRQP